MKKIKRKEILLRDVSLDGAIEGVIASLVELKSSKEAVGYSGIYIDGDYERDYDGDNYWEVTIYGYRFETDKEFQVRKAYALQRSRAAKKAAKTKAANKDKIDAALYEKLKKKYEGGKK